MTSSPKRKREVDDDVFSCPVCYEPMFEAQTFQCGHCICLKCHLTISAEEEWIHKCHDCRCLVKTVTRNHFLSSMVERVFPKEYADLKPELELLMLVKSLNQGLVSCMKIVTKNISWSDAIRMVQFLSRIRAWTRHDEELLHEIEEQLSDTCCIFRVCKASSFAIPDCEAVFNGRFDMYWIYERTLGSAIAIYNSGTTWFKEPDQVQRNESNQ